MHDRVILAVGGIACRVLARVYQEISLFPQTTPYLRHLLVTGFDSDARARSELVDAIPGAEIAEDENTLVQMLQSAAQQTTQVILHVVNVSSFTAEVSIPMLKMILDQSAAARILVVGIVDGAQKSNDDGSRKAERARICMEELQSELRAYRERLCVCIVHRNAFGEKGVMGEEAKEGFMELFSHVLWLLLTCRCQSEDVFNRFFVDRLNTRVFALGHVQTDTKTGHRTADQAESYNWLAKGVDADEIAGKIVFGADNGYKSHLVDIVDELVFAPCDVGQAIDNISKHDRVRE